MTNNSKIREKIAALLKKTAENGASEAEAMSAMKHAAKLMAEHGVTMADIKNKTEASTDFIKKWANQGDKNLSSFDNLIATSIAKYTDTKVWIDRSTKRESKLMFFGYRVDVELADYIRDVCNQALEIEWKKFSMSIPQGTRAKQRKSFQVGMAVRLNKRLSDLKEENSQPTESRALVVVKTQLVKSAFEEMNLKIKSGGTIRYNANSAFSAGQSAAENVRFNRAVHEGPQGGVKLIS